jgi:hypothetical protein
MQQIKGCPNPHCESKGDIRAIEYNDFDESFRCGSCGLTGPSAEKGMAEALRMWNDLPRKEQP